VTLLVCIPCHRKRDAFVMCADAQETVTVARPGRGEAASARCCFLHILNSKASH
jgi:hypothetical protein